MKSVPYQVSLNWMLAHTCNLRCDYCFDYATNAKQWKNHVSKVMWLMVRRVTKMPSLDSGAVLRTLKKSGKTFLITFSGGEPFLVPNIIQASIALSGDHYIAFVSNLTSRKIIEFGNTVDPARVQGILASLHIKELERTRLTSRFIDNYLFLKSKGFPIAATVVAYPPLARQIDSYRRFFHNSGISFDIKPFLGNYKGTMYPHSYTGSELDAFGLRRELVMSFSRKGKWCNAGYNAGVIMPNGNVLSCILLSIKSQYNCAMGNIYKSINLHTRLLRCPLSCCHCPFPEFEKDLFDQALTECAASQ